MQSQTAKATTASRPPVTQQRLVRDLQRLGVAPGQVLLVHASLSSLGWVAGGAPAVVSALCAAVGPDGHVVVPTGTEENSTTSRAHRARIAMMTLEEARRFEQEEMPAFDRDRTPSGMGAISEALRTTDGAVRSGHPQSSFAAIGPRSASLMAGHPLDCHLGPDSPLGKLLADNAQVLMIGVGFENFTGFHLAEYTYTRHPPMQKYACVLPAADGKRSWESYEDVVLDDQEFDVIGKALEESPAGIAMIKNGEVGYARCRLLPLRPAVRFAEEWLLARRRATPR
jgi:aminoglycoside 3-N-acetyltransferase